MSLYDDLGGFDAILRTCRHWHALCSADPVAAHPFEHMTMPRHDERLAAYLSEATGGPPLYTAGYGDESFMQRLHAGHGEHDELDERCLELFDRALSEVGHAPEAAARLSAYFRGSTHAMRAYGEGEDLVPPDLPLPHAE